MQFLLKFYAILILSFWKKGSKTLGESRKKCLDQDTSQKVTGAQRAAGR